MVYIHSLSSLILAGSVAKSSAFVSPHNLMIKPKCHGIVNPMSLLALEEKKDGLDKVSSINLDTFISSLPSPEDLKENILEVSILFVGIMIFSIIGQFYEHHTFIDNIP